MLESIGRATVCKPFNPLFNMIVCWKLYIHWINIYNSAILYISVCNNNEVYVSYINLANPRKWSIFHIFSSAQPSTKGRCLHACTSRIIMMQMRRDAMRNLFQMQMAQWPRMSIQPSKSAAPNTFTAVHQSSISNSTTSTMEPPRVPLKPLVTYRSSAFPFRDRDYPYVLSLHIRQFRFGSSESSLIYIFVRIESRTRVVSAAFLFAFGSRREFVMDFLADGMCGYCVVVRGCVTWSSKATSSSVFSSDAS